LHGQTWSSPFSSRVVAFIFLEILVKCSLWFYYKFYLLMNWLFCILGYSTGVKSCLGMVFLPYQPTCCFAVDNLRFQRMWLTVCNVRIYFFSNLSIPPWFELRRNRIIVSFNFILLFQWHIRVRDIRNLERLILFLDFCESSC
jgi:hypothetical protein